MIRVAIVFLIALLVLCLVGCGGDSAPAGSGGEAQAGEEVFSQVAAPACNTCHSREAGVVMLGPSLATIGSEATSRVPGQSAEDYLRESVTQPNVHIVETFAAGVMPETYGSQLTAKQIEDLVAYMLTLK
jgi:mono/diheme cytochrome c family protein